MGGVGVEVCWLVLVSGAGARCICVTKGAAQAVSVHRCIADRLDGQIVWPRRMR